MKWFLKKKIKSEKDSENMSEKCRKLRLNDSTVIYRQAEEIGKLEKEAVYWKEKALNFRRFHQ